MDTSKTYIEMCDCEEIQKQRVRKAPRDTWQVGDFYYTATPIEGCISVHNDASSYGLGVDTVWLPRQDQLQLLSGLTWQEFDKECLKYDAETKEQAGIQVVIERLAKTTLNS